SGGSGSSGAIAWSSSFRGRWPGLPRRRFIAVGCGAGPRRPISVSLRGVLNECAVPFEEGGIVGDRQLLPAVAGAQVLASLADKVPAVSGAREKKLAMVAGDNEPPASLGQALREIVIRPAFLALEHAA